MRFLVIGRSGQVATELRRQVPEGDSLTVWARPEIDLTRPEACAAAVAGAQADVIINAAAYTAVDKAEAEEATAHLINAEAPAAMARAAAAREIPFLHVSTDYVYDGAGTVPFVPTSLTGPLNAYGRTKLAGDQDVIAAGGPYIVLRASWVVSAHGSNFVKTMLRLGHAQVAKQARAENGEREKLTIVADQIGGPTPASEVARALIAMARACHARVTPSGIYHFSGAPDVSWADLAREIFARSGLACDVEDIPTSAYPTPAERPANSRLDCSTTEAVFGIKRPDWRIGLAGILKELGEI